MNKAFEDRSVPRERCRSHTGFTLLELLLVMTILGIAIAPIVTMFNRSWRSTIESKRVFIASSLAQKKLETLLGTTRYSHLQGDRSGRFESPYSEYEWTLKVRSYQGEGSDPDVEIKLLKIKVEFPSVYGDRRTVSCTEAQNCSAWDLSTLITKKDRFRHDSDRVF